MLKNLDFLNGIRIADFCWAGAGPFCTKVFSDFGAEVIKVESTERVDSVRAGGPFKDGLPGINRSGYFASRNSGKKSITIDLKSDEGRQLALRLIEKSDVMTNNFGPGVMQRLGLGYEDVIKIKPDIIDLSMPMYGQDGPNSSLLGVGMTISAVSGLTGLTAYESSDPVGPGTHYPDHAANPYHSAFAILSALRHRRITGRGMKIDLAQVESTINFLGPAIINFAVTGQDPKPIGNRSLSQSPHNLFRCKEPDSWCAIAAQTEEEWLALANVIGGQELACNPSFHGVQNRLEKTQELESIISNWACHHTVAEAVAILQKVGVTTARVACSKDLLTDDLHLKEREFWQQIDHPEMGVTTFTSPPYRIDGHRLQLKRPPLIGEHTDAVLRDILGCTDEEIRSLNSAGVLK